jgi:hypothetical protein
MPLISIRRSRSSSSPRSRPLAISASFLLEALRVAANLRGGDPPDERNAATEQPHELAIAADRIAVHTFGLIGRVSLPE